MKRHSCRFEKTMRRAALLEEAMILRDFLNFCILGVRVKPWPKKTHAAILRDAQMLTNGVCNSIEAELSR